jgi:hypothetical protein
MAPALVDTQCTILTIPARAQQRRSALQNVLLQAPRPGMLDAILVFSGRIATSAAMTGNSPRRPLTDCAHK